MVGDAGEAAGAVLTGRAVPRTGQLVRWIDAISGWAGAVSALLLFALLAITCYDVGLRYLLNSPTSWATEISTYILVAVAFLGASYAHLKDRHIRVEVIPERFAGAIRRLDVTAAWAAFIFVAVSAWQALLYVRSDYVNGTRAFSLLVTPLYLPEIPVAVGLLLLACAVLREAYGLAPPPDKVRERGGWLLLAAMAVALWQLGARPRPIGAIGLDSGSLIVVVAAVLAAWLWSGWPTALSLGILAGVAALLYLARGLGVGVLVAILGLGSIALMVIRVRIAFALGLVGLAGMYFLLPSPQPQILAERAWSSTNAFTLTAVPMFVLMGGFLLRSGLSDMVFDALVMWLGRFPGGLAHAGVGACAIFAAVSGSSVATAATIGMVACPEMVKRGYSPRLTYGSMAAGGTLGILIPPSIPMIIYGSMVGTPVTALFIGGIIPGIMLTLAFMGVILIWTTMHIGAAPKSERVSWAERWRSLLDILPISLLILAVLGSLYAGVATATEAGALGALCALLACVVRRRLRWRDMKEIFLETAVVTSFLLVIIVGASILTYIFEYLRLPQILVEGVQAAGLGRGLVMTALVILYVILGGFIDSISMMVMTLPVVFPLVTSLGFDPVWFGIVLVILLEVGLVTPPVGMNVFVMRGLSGQTSIKEIFAGAMPFAAIMLLALVLLYFVPQLVTWLPSRIS